MLRVSLAGLLLSLSAGGAALASAPAATILRHEIRAELDVAAHHLEAVDVMRVAVPHEEPIRFLLHRDLAVRRIVLGDGTALEWSASPRWDPRHFWRRPPYADLEGFDVAREVEVSAPPGGWREALTSLRVEYGGVIADSLHAPERSYGRSFETTSGRIVTEGAYLDGGTFWVPWSGDDLFAFDLTVDGPSDWRVVSQGDLALDEADGARRRTRWLSADPMEEIYLIAGPYRKHEVAHGDVQVLAYVYEDTGEDVFRPYLDATGAVLDRYGERFGAYPFGKFALVENYWQTGYGMPSFTFLGDRVIRLPFIVHTSYPHEILHNWWGNGVYLRRGEGNWCEGLTTYGADYRAKEVEGADAARDYRRSTLQGYRDFAVAGGKDFPLRGFRERDSAATQAVGYGKTLMVFHMLRRNLGDERFDDALRRFFEANRFRRAGWDELRASFEDAAGGGELGSFFRQWVDRPGAPVLRLENVRVEPLETGRSLLRATVTQQEPPFELHVPVLVEGEDGDWHRTSVDLGLVEDGIEIPLPFERPTRIAVDPDFEIFRLLHTEEVPAALSGVLGASRVRVVIGSEASGPLRSALLDAANEWGGDSTVTVVEESGELADFDGGTWFFGPGRALDRLRAAGLPGVPGETGGTVVAAWRLEGETGAPRPAGVLLPGAPEDVSAVARKVHHYSKYSWLRFEGSRNVAKGLWEPGPSPLTVRLDG